MLEAANLSITTEDAAVQRIVGAREITMAVTYQVPGMMEMFGFRAPALTYTRPIFVIG